nr:immunoglobulin heavy chain junction region [Macaca mulatta]MOW19331.1 immunoglobulin heavy chain junction region [Macaca mulatta]MOW20849.1 immunoglobulin heavy chain junction region [Macaca mulatta]MOW22190.1 immunoglobulin heavy chain junction region [Macaca mulatta]
CARQKVSSWSIDSSFDVW